MREVYLKKIHDKDGGDWKDRVQVFDAKTDEPIYNHHYDYRINGVKVWDEKDAYRRLRALHLKHDLYKEVFKCQCGNIIKIPEKVEAKIDELNRISFELNCSCGEKVTVECDTLRTT